MQILDEFPNFHNFYLIYRMGWPGLVTHPFWEGRLTHLAKDLVMSQDVQGSMATTARSSVFVDGTASVLGKVKTLDTIMNETAMSNVHNVESTSRPGKSESRREKTCLWGVRPGSTQTRLYSHIRWRET